MMIVIYSVNEILEGGTMKVSREQAAENRERIVNTAARLFREHGFDGVGVADIMQSAGLTHGGFYGHFASKDDLAAEACARALEKSVTRWNALKETEGDPLAVIVGSYLAETHRDRPGTGCVVAALGSDVARQGRGVRQAVTKGVEGLIDRLAQLFPGRSKAVKRRKAVASFAAMVGAVIMARAVDDAELSREILDAVSGSVLPSR
jgi:TetR/AcrR family transcriptional repressor of nem operon